MTRRFRAVSFILLVFVAPIGHATPFDAPTDLRLEGAAGGECKGTLKLTPTHAGEAVTVFADDLVSKSGTPIRSALVTVAPVGAPVVMLLQPGQSQLPTFHLQPGPPLRLVVTVSGISAGGEYAGAVELWISGKRVHTVNLHVFVTDLPKITVPMTARIVKLVDPDTRLGEWLASLLLPKEERLNSVDRLEITNTGGDAIVEGEPEFIAEGASDGYRLPAAAYMVSAQVSSQRGPRGEIIRVPLHLYRDEIPPDQYAASINVKVRGVDAPQIIPLTISLRADPLWPLIVLIIGLALGRLIRWSETEGERQAALLARLDRVERSVAPADLSYLAGGLRAARQDVYNSQFTRADVEVTTLESRGDLLRQLDELDNGLDSNDASHQPILADVAAARTAVRIGDDTLAAQLTVKVRTAVGQLAVGPSSQVTKAAAEAENAASRAVRAAQPSRSHGARRSVAAIIGMTLEARAETYRWIVRPLLYLLLVLFLTYLGMRSLWVENPTFGAGLMADYIAVLMWGMSSEVASKTLSSLKGP